jgi:hypothetical protein
VTPEERQKAIRELYIRDLKARDADPRYQGMTHESPPDWIQKEEPIDESVLETHGMQKPSHQLLSLATDPTPQTESDRAYALANQHDVASALASGPKEIGRRAVNLVTPEGHQPEWATDAAVIDAQKKARAYGTALPFLGENVALAPVSALGRGGLAAVDALLPRAAGGSVLRAALRGGAKTAVAGAEGAALGALTSKPGQTEDGMTLGSAMSMFPRLAAMGGSALNRGLVKKSTDAMRLEAEIPGLQLPLANAAKDSGLSGVAGTLYRSGLPNLPGARGPLAKQQEEAADYVRRHLSKEAIPPGAAPLLSGNPAEQMDHLRAAFNDVYDQVVNHYNFSIPQDLEDQVKARITKNILAKDPLALAAGNDMPGPTKERLALAIRGQLEAMADDQTGLVGGRNAMWAKTNAAALRDDPRVVGNPFERAHYPSAVGAIDDLIENQLPSAASARFAATRQPYTVFSRLNDAAEKANKNEGRYSFGQLKDASDGYTPPTPHDVDLNEIADRGINVFDKRKLQPNWEGRYIATGLGLGGAFAGGGIPAAAALGGSVYGLVPKASQNFLMGQTRMQKRIADILRNNPQTVRNLGSAARQVGTQELNDDGT